MTDVIEAIFNCNYKMLKKLLPDKRWVNSEIPGTEGCTPLHLVVGIDNVHGKGELIEYLLEKGANPNARSHDDLTPVHIAAMWNNCSELEKLLQNGGNPWLTDNENKNSFDLAIDNHNYEAYQLLNEYLSEEKLNFRNILSLNDAKSTYLESAKTNCKVVKMHDTEFYSANENFPMYFSVTDDESSDCLLEVSKILNKKSACQKNFKQNSVSKSRDLSFDIYISDSASDCNEITQKLRPKTEISSTTDETEAYSTSENEFIINEPDSSDTIIDTDNTSGIVLIEKDSLSFHTSINKTSDKSDLTKIDWKSCRSVNTSSSSDKSCSYSDSVLIPCQYKKLSNSKIYQKLKALGDNPGPVYDSTRNVYLRRLTRLKNGCRKSCTLPSPKYCQELYIFLEGKLNSDKVQYMLNIMTQDFNSFDPDQKWREGNQRCSFNYFLLDPRVTQNLPSRIKELTFEKAFLTFVDALFYVGKGMRSRPYMHLLEAAKSKHEQQLKNDKISHIIDIWESGLGVISLHCFNNSIPVEAYTQEACIIEAIGIENLTNLKIGDYYGTAAKWKRSWKRKVGVMLLHKALQIFILEGEKQILPKDVRSK